MIRTLNRKTIVALVLASLFVCIAAAQNFNKSLQHKSQKLPEKLETQQKYQKWVNRWKERFEQVQADNFKKVDDGEIISSTSRRYKFSDVNTEEVTEEISKVKGDKYTVIAPNKLEYLTFRAYSTPSKEATSSYIYFYGIRDDKVLSGAMYECKRTSCWFDRPFFLNPDLFYIAEIQEKIYPEEPNRCQDKKICVYQLFLHQFDLKTNTRTTFALSELLTDLERIQQVLDDL